MQSIIFTTVFETSKILAEFLDIVNTESSIELSDDTTALESLLIRAQELEDRLKLLKSSLPPSFAFERSQRDETLVSAPRWLQRGLRDRRAPEYSHKKYAHINVANASNWMRHCHIRLLQLQILIFLRLRMDWQPLKTKLWEIESVVDDINATIVYFLTSDEDGEFNTSDRLEDVRGVRCFFLLRALAAAKTALEFVNRRGVDVTEKLEWLCDMCEFMRIEMGFELLVGPDPMEID